MSGPIGDDDLGQIVAFLGGELNGRHAIVIGSARIICPVHQPGVGGIDPEWLRQWMSAHPAECLPYQITSRLDADRRVYEPLDTAGLPATTTCGMLIRIERFEAGLAAKRSRPAQGL